MKPRLIIFSGILLVFANCNTSSSNQFITDSISGHWKMHQVFQKDVDVSQEHNPEMERYIIFSEDGTFESGGSPYGKNTGTYEFDRQQKILFIDSDAGEDDDSRWRIEIAGDTMKWEGLGSEFAESFRLIHIRE